MIGQKNIIKYLESFTIDTFPRSLLIVGEKGMGKHTLISHIQTSILNLPVIDISDRISAELIENIYERSNQSIYVIDISKISEKEQNSILKFVEEPLLNSYIIILAENFSNILNTIVNRCIVLQLEPYSRDELATFITTETDRELILDVIRSPGKIKETNLSDIRAILDVCEKICTKLSLASYPNTLSIASKINFKDNYDRFDIELFFDLLTYSLYSHYLEENNVLIFNLLSITREHRKKLRDNRVNKELFFANFLTELWKAARYGYN